MKRGTGKASTRFKPSGLVFLLIAFLTQMAALNTGENLLYLIAASVFSYPLFSYFSTRQNLRGLDIDQRAPERVSRGERFSINHQITNRKKWVAAQSIRLQSGSLTPERDGVQPEHLLAAYCPRIGPGESVSVPIDHVLERRGLHTLPHVTVTSGFPFGLFQRRIPLAASGEILVWPRVRAIRQGVLDNLLGTGETFQLIRGDGDEFFSLRDYLPGDDIRHIAWKVSARLDRLVVRELEPSSSRTIVIFFDTRCPLSDSPQSEEVLEEFESAVELVASVAVAYLERQYSVGLFTPDHTVPVGTGKAHSCAILDAMALVSPASPSAFVDDWHLSNVGRIGASNLFISADFSRWGGSSGFRDARVLDPREIVIA